MATVADSEDLRPVVAELAARLAALERLVLNPPADWDPRGSRLRRIVRGVAGHFGVSEPALFGRSRTAELAWIRMLAMWMCHEFCRVSSGEIGRVFSRDHSTVLYALECVNDRVRLEPKIRQELEVVRALVAQCLEGL